MDERLVGCGYLWWVVWVAVRRWFLENVGRCGCGAVWLWDCVVVLLCVYAAMCLCGCVSFGCLGAWVCLFSFAWLFGHFAGGVCVGRGVLSYAYLSLVRLCA